MQWRIVPEGRPGAVRNCPRCDQKRRFVSTDNFRVNGHQSRVDVWLIYQCSVCKYTWKLTIFTRVLPSSINKELFHLFQHNDQETALRYSFDFPLIRRCGAEPETDLPFEVTGPELSEEQLTQGGPLEVEVHFELPLEVRLAVILSQKIPVSRGRIERAMKSGAIQIVSDGQVRAKPPKKLNQTVLVRLDRDALRP